MKYIENLIRLTKNRISLLKNNSKLKDELDTLKNEYYLIPKNKNESMSRITAYPLTYNQDGLTTWHICDFMDNKHFIDSYNLGKKTGSWADLDLHWRVYTVCWAARIGISLEGDFVECGVNRGGFARAIINYTNFSKSEKKFYLLDTYCGINKQHLTEEEIINGINPNNPNQTDCYQDVLETFKEFKNVKIVKGSIPETLNQVTSNKIAFLSIDLNNAKPEIAAANFFWDKLSPGAIIVLDDYAYSDVYKIQRIEFNNFAKDKNVEILTLPTGQGLIIKPETKTNL
ncbi:MAG: TylF/MycF/NovP-related O-methyltransferase [Thermodesulfobacteriota bacterium]